MSRIPNLKTLDLSKNNLTDVPAEASKVQLSVLDLSNNNIEQFNDTIVKSLPKNIRLNLNGNQLYELSVDDVEVLKDMPHVLLEHNPWQCDCVMKEALQWCEEHNMKMNVTCASPKNFEGKSWEILKKVPCDVRLMAPNSLDVPDDSQENTKKKSPILQSPTTLIFVGVFMAAMVVAIAYSVTTGRRMKMKKVEAAKNVIKNQDP